MPLCIIACYIWVQRIVTSYVLIVSLYTVLKYQAMNIAIYADDYIGNRGISIVGYELVSRLMKRNGLNFVIIGSSENLIKFRTKFNLDSASTTVSKITFHTYKVSCLRFFRKKLIDYLIIKNIDVFWYMKNYGTFRFSKNAFVLVTIHDLMGFIRPELQGGKATFLRTIRRYINVLTLKQADCLVAVSSFTATEVSERLKIDNSRFKVVPNGVSSDKFVSDLKDRTILYTGAFNEYKNLDFLADAFLGSSLPKCGWKLILIGPNSKIKGCSKDRMIKKYKIHNSISILPEVADYKFLASLYRKTYCVCSASEYEGFGLTVLEGMSAGARILASDIVPHNEITQNSPDCRLLKLGEKSNWIDAFNNLETIYLADNTPSELNRGIALEFNWDKAANDYFTILKDRMC